MHCSKCGNTICDDNRVHGSNRCRDCRNDYSREYSRKQRESNREEYNRKSAERRRLRRQDILYRLKYNEYYRNYRKGKHGSE